LTLLCLSSFLTLCLSASHTHSLSVSLLCSGQKGHILAGFHYDLNFLTIHGKSRFPGLYVWTRSGEKKQVSVPDGCLLIQAGKQIEYLTGGHVLAGFHEVVINDNTLKVIEKKKQDNQSLWRVSSTLFSNINSDLILQPLEQFQTPQTMAAYPPIYAGEQVERELKAISLFGSSN
jgi:isopenicillin N synthase-like dioxygenase